MMTASLLNAGVALLLRFERAMPSSPRHLRQAMHRPRSGVLRRRLRLRPRVERSAHLRRLLHLDLVHCALRRALRPTCGRLAAECLGCGRSQHTPAGDMSSPLLIAGACDVPCAGIMPSCCGGTCVDLESRTDSCGAFVQCWGGDWRSSCPNALPCIPLASISCTAGSCGTKCPAGQACTGGKCVSTAEPKPEVGSKWHGGALAGWARDPNGPAHPRG